MARDTFQLIGSALHDKYRVDEVVGEGGFGVVYKGFHLSFEQPIAIKCLKVPAHFTHEANELFLRKFREEGKHLAALAQHGSVTQVFDFGIEEREGGVGIPFLVLEWLEGSDLETLFRERREAGDVYAEREALELLLPAIDALALAHDDDIAHRDIKPANLFMAETKRGRVLKVLDFGIAKAMQEGETATQIATKTSSGFSAFSPSYGAPEQFRSKRYGATGPWTDVHAFGLILVEMVTGKPALDGEEMVDFFESSTEDVRPTPRARGAEVSDEFEALCSKALALSPKERFAHAGELLDAVKALLDGTRDAKAADTVFQGPVVEDDADDRERKKLKKKDTRRVAPTERWEAPEPVAAHRDGPSTSSTRPLLWGGAAVGAALIVWLATRSEEPAASESVTPASEATSVATEEQATSASSPAPTPPSAPRENPFPHGSALAQRYTLETQPPKDVAAPPPTAKRTASGLAYVAKRAGLGALAGPQDRVKVAYSGWTTDGRMFDTTYKHENHEVWHDLRALIAGLAEGIALMRTGSIYQLWIPADLAYGDKPSGNAPAGMLVFKVELVSVEAARASRPAPPRPAPNPHADPTGTSIYDSLVFKKPPALPPRPAPPAPLLVP